MNDPKRILLILLCSALLGIIAGTTFYHVSMRTHAIERQTEEIERLRRDCPCAKR